MALDQSCQINELYSLHYDSKYQLILIIAEFIVAPHMLCNFTLMNFFLLAFLYFMTLIKYLK